MDHGAYQEGRAAARLGLRKTQNPYLRAAQEHEAKGLDSDRLYELASDWESGRKQGEGDSMARGQFFNDPEDVEWLFSTHLKGRPGRSLRGTKSFVLFGNEDSPDRLHVYAVKEPLMSTPYYVVRFKNGRWLDTMGLVWPGGARQVRENPRRVSHSQVRRGLLGERRASKGPTKIGGYPDKRGEVLSGQGKSTGWHIEYSVHVYRLPESLSWMTSTAEAVVLSKGKRKAVGLSYGEGMILRGVEVLGPVSSEELSREAEAEAEYWLSVDIRDAEEQAEREREAEG
jgi:hypothetical protein